jgi:hypothetical protein
MLNALSIDVEDYFHVEAFADTISPSEWRSFQPRVEKNVHRILEILKHYETSATFFILGWIAERFPQLVRVIADEGHEIGCHGLMDLVQKPVDCYRAPSFSIMESTLWALDILAEEGFRIDSSIFPVRHDLYGMPNCERFPHWRNQILEFPPTTLRKAKTNFGVAGGGYLRLLPYGFTRWAISEINRVEHQPVMVYFHPWELDPEQPRISARLRSKIRHYTNLSRMQHKIERLLQDFRFSTISNVCSHLPARETQVAHNPDFTS